MAPAASSKPEPWSVEYDTVRRHNLFRNPPAQTQYPALLDAIAPHVDSFNVYFEPDGLLQRGLDEIGTKSWLDGRPIPDPNEPPVRRNKLSIKIRGVTIAKPSISTANKVITDPKKREVLPRECRERHASYKGRLSCKLQYKVNNADWREVSREMGQIPIMLRTKKCYLEKMGPIDLVNVKEESDELGGYFIINGNEKLIRMLINTKRNFPMAIVRPSFSKRGPTYTKYGVQIRSVRPDETSQTNVLQYLNDGNIIFRFSFRKLEYLVPFVLIAKALVETNDREIFEAIVGPAGSKGLKEKQWAMDRAELLLRTYKKWNIHGMSKTRAYLGNKFRVALMLHDDFTDEEVGTEFLRKIVLPHLGCVGVTQSQNMDKFKMMMFMARKLYAMVEGECAPDNPDAASMHEILLPGFLYGMLLKENLEEYINTIRIETQTWLRTSTYSKRFNDPNFEQEFITNIIGKTRYDVGQKMEYFMSTGNLISPSGLDLQQVSGYTVMAEKINFYRFISHFRMVHRGSFFAQMKTTTVRKLLPESWGFLCPVHTPDGSPCGLLNHLAHKCRIATKPVDASKVAGLIAQLGVIPISLPTLKESVPVQLDGRILGYCSPQEAKRIHDTLRYWKVEKSHNIPVELEIGYIPNSNGGQYPGIYMFSGAARMYREVKYLPLDKLDYVGPLEQVYMSIAVRPHEIRSGDHTHVEFSPTNILSIIANQTPFSDQNQSPRNMYQCQMGKQTMGNYGTAIKYRTDNKTYRIQSAQTPVVRPPLYNTYGLDNFPNGTNSIVAVISYTGYDMDDAMIINKSSDERGFGYGTIYKTHIYSIAETSRGARFTTRVSRLFGFPSTTVVKAEVLSTIDFDGLPRIGARLTKGTPIACHHAVVEDPRTGNYINTDGDMKFERYKDDETAYVEEVRLLGAEEGNKPLQAVSVKFRIPRPPIIGDKFSSRHGQKGVCSQKWQTVDMPFTESGMQPDTIINPHAFPSRMTIGMFVESLAGKSGALHGLAQDSTPWTFDENHTAVDFFGHQLQQAGYNYYGNEPMYSGITGQELMADIYIGCVYYQRLRHMVNDKYQVRTTGPVHRHTLQPIKGRKKGGGIRVGEMERDSLLAHGAAFLLQDRLLNCSDYMQSWICRECGSFLGATPVIRKWGLDRSGSKNDVRCRRCARVATGRESRDEVWEDGRGTKYVGGTDCRLVAVPGVLRYLDTELASMGVKMKYIVDP
ncbi:putative DNA-directed RNA polymerase I subunit beta [Microthyrium microscopicum]|uniref:DNA-directed RNA polymerase subunit beta n=1 Tax=Microthyrium microscopicum TaxID=703497 RepID=A0A6A6UJF3_9PEZI|nr:putative DNA-directed RNA polymerase I subunit beta [Microthyrium microscopicum]